MASDRKQFERSFAHWEELHTSGSYSVPDSEGVTAILISDYPYHVSKTDVENKDMDEIDFNEFCEEGYSIAAYLGSVGIGTEVVAGVTKDTFIDTIRDTHVSSIITIGHGSISGIYMEGGKNGILDWHTAAKATTHLKTGTFTQRHCGIFVRNLNVPLGYFTMSDFINVRAAVGLIFSPSVTRTNDPEEHKIRSVIDNGYIASYRDMRMAFSYPATTEE